MKDSKTAYILSWILMGSLPIIALALIWAYGFMPVFLMSIVKVVYPLILALAMIFLFAVGLSGILAYKDRKQRDKNSHSVPPRPTIANMDSYYGPANYHDSYNGYPSAPKQSEEKLPSIKTMKSE